MKYPAQGIKGRLDFSGNLEQKCEDSELLKQKTKENDLRAEGRKYAKKWR